MGAPGHGGAQGTAARAQTASRSRGSAGRGRLAAIFLLQLQTGKTKFASLSMPAKQLWHQEPSPEAWVAVAGGQGGAELPRSLVTDVGTDAGAGLSSEGFGAEHCWGKRVCRCGCACTWAWARGHGHVHTRRCWHRCAPTAGTVCGWRAPPAAKPPQPPPCRGEPPFLAFWRKDAAAEHTRGCPARSLTHTQLLLSPPPPLVVHGQELREGNGSSKGKLSVGKKARHGNICNHRWTESGQGSLNGF